MAGTFPANPNPNTSTLIDDQPVTETDSPSRESQARITEGQIWRIKMKFPKMLRAQFAPIFGFLASQRGSFGKFQVSLEQHNEPQGVASGTPKIFGGTLAKGNTSTVLDGWNINTVDQIKSGDIFKFNNHNKVYMFTNDVDSNSSGVGVHNFIPPCIVDVPDNTLITVRNVQFTVRNVGGVQEWKTTYPNLSVFSLEFKEAP